MKISMSETSCNGIKLNENFVFINDYPRHSV